MTVAAVACGEDKPRVISELKKNNNKRKLIASTSVPDDTRPKIAGELLWSATPTQWHLKLAAVRRGNLVVHCCATGEAELRFPLHHINLQAGHTPRTFTLATSYGIPLASFQTLTEEEYHRWVRVLAVEVLRQTPLQDVRYLDIIGITKHEEILRRGRSEEFLTTIHQRTHEWHKFSRNKQSSREECNKRERPEFSQWLNCVERETEEKSRSNNMDFDIKNMKIRRAQKVRPKLPFLDAWTKLHGHNDLNTQLTPPNPVTALCVRSKSVDDLRKRRNQFSGTFMTEKKLISDESGISSGDENTHSVSEMLPTENFSYSENTYVSVREKKQFFESLSEEKLLTKVETNLNRSCSIGNINSAPQPGLRSGQRASSLHDLTGNTLPVKEIRRRFENGSCKDLTKSFEELRFDDDAASMVIVEEDEVSNDANNGEINENYPEVESVTFVKTLQKNVETKTSYANIKLCHSKSPEKSVRFSDTKEKHYSLRESDKLEEPEANTVPEQVTRTWKPLVKISQAGRQNDINVCQIPNEHVEGVMRTDVPTLMVQRKLQRGERKLGKLRVQITEVEETIKNIAEDLYSIGPNTLKKRSGLEVFAALRRRLEEESSRLERLQEETAKVISENQRVLLKMRTHDAWVGPNKVMGPE